ncbi:MAG: hypothetical protein ACTS22_03900 [Phycisphaerales bacterium]
MLSTPRGRILCPLALLLTAPVSQGQSFRIDLTSPQNQTVSPDTNGNAWNNYVRGTFIRLVDTSGGLSAAATVDGIGFGGTTPIGESLPTGEGLPNPDPFFLGELAIASATEDFHFRFDDTIGDPETLGYEFSNLDQSLTYTIRVFGSRILDITQESEYTVTGGNGSQTASLVTSGPNIGSDGMSFANDNEVAEFPGVTPTVDGTILVEGNAIQGTFVFFNIIELSVDTGGPVRLCADVNENGVTDPGDFTAWVAAFNSGDLRADANQNGSNEPGDFTAWVAAYNLGPAGPTCTP